jgi:putative serine protease PepD
MKRLPPAPAPSPGPHPSQNRSHRHLAVGAALVAVAVAGGGVVAARSLDDADGAAGATTTVAISQTKALSGDGTTAGQAASAIAGADPHGDLDVYDVAQSIRPSVVTISSAITQQTASGELSGQAVGTGIIVSKDGEILTNAHVIDGATDIHVRFAGDTEPTTARLVASDPSNDLALLKVEVDRDLTPVTFADPSTTRIGDQVMAIGFALDLDGDPTVTTGIVSAIGRTLETGNAEGDVLDGLIQTDAAISSGNSGGPLVNAAGQVVGIDTAVARSDASVSASNIGFAIGSAEAQRVLAQLQSGQAHEEGFLGISAAVRTDGGEGAIVASVEPGSPAADAGIDASDVIVAIDGNVINGAGGVVAAIRDHQPGDHAEIVVVRNGERQTLDVTLGQRPK